MIVYHSTKEIFHRDVESNTIDDIILDSYKKATGKSVGDSELRSWRNSLPCMDRVLADTAIPADTGVAIEFSIPTTSKRVDFILTGKKENGERTAIIVELKQWESSEPTDMDGIVSTYVGGSMRDVSHPSYQAWSYATLIEDFNESVREDPIHLHPCAYLHNYRHDDGIRSKHYQNHIQFAPLFLKSDTEKLREFIKQNVSKGDDGETMYRIRDGKIRPSKSLADHLASLLQGNQEFCMIDDQKVVYETALSLSKKSSITDKNVLIVEGGPGTGKSVVAINLLVELTNQGLLAQYVTKNSAPREVYQSKLAGTFTKTRISNLFVGSGKFTATENGTFNALIVDEAHRLNAKSGMFSNLGEHQVKEIIISSCFSIFFIDQHQKVHWKDVGSVDIIKHYAKELGASITKLNLNSQFRCNGSDGYLAWLNNTLDILESANPTLENIDYEFKVCGSPAELRDLIYKRNQKNNKSRMVAGYCWDWLTKKKDPLGYDIEFPEFDFKARWNLSKDGMQWIIKPESVKEIGCIHTCQGLELDYVGVIIGDDFIVRDGKIITSAENRSSMDSSIKGYKKLLKSDKQEALDKADQIIKNTYRTLMSRGQKGCFIYSVDPETNEYLKQAAQGAKFEQLSNENEIYQDDQQPFIILPQEDIKPYINSIPLFDVKVAAGEFSHEQWINECDWVELPEHIAIREGYFVAQVIGESMNRRIPNGSWCLFKANPLGSRDGKIVLVQHQDIHDSSTGQYTIKKYQSTKEQSEHGWQHSSITLSPMSDQPEYTPIELEEYQLESLSVIGEFITKLD